MLVFFISFIITFLSVPVIIKKLHGRNILVRDKYKKNILIPTLGGLGIVLGIHSGVIASQIIQNIHMEFFVLYSIILAFGIIGLLDDLTDLENRFKIIIPIFLAIPLIGNNLNLIWLIPTYVMVVANLINMHSGYNGLQLGLSNILLMTIGIKLFSLGLNMNFLMIILGSTLAFMYYNKYPSKIFMGNIGSFIIGSSIGVILVVNNLKLFGIFILIPHILNFLLYVLGHVIKKEYDPKFAKVRYDNTIIAPNKWVLKWIPSLFWKLTENQSTYLMYLTTVIFCIAGLIVF